MNMLCWVQIAQAQVVSDDIENRIKLPLNQPLNSSTVDCTVQWNCVDEKLTGKCIQYHNDQWFYFNTGEKSRYYINLSGQHCRDTRGVQVVVIDGTPCGTETYKIITCYSTGDQTDIFIEFDSLLRKHTYLVNIDGYLHDFCSFDIEFSDRPKGLPAEVKQNLELDKKIDGLAVTLSWKIPDDYAYDLTHFEIWRKSTTGRRSVLVATVRQLKNAFGVDKRQYAYRDSVTEEGDYEYLIVGETIDRQRVLVSQSRVKLHKKNTPGPKPYIELNLNYRNDTPLSILVFDALSNRLLRNIQIKFDKEKDAHLKVYVEEYNQGEVRRLRVQIVNNFTGAVRELLY